MVIRFVIYQSCRFEIIDKEMKAVLKFIPEVSTKCSFLLSVSAAGSTYLECGPIIACFSHQSVILQTAPICWTKISLGRKCECLETWTWQAYCAFTNCPCESQGYVEAKKLQLKMHIHADTGCSFTLKKDCQKEKTQSISFRSFLTFTSTAPGRNQCELNFSPSLIIRSFGALHSSYPLLHAYVLDFPAGKIIDRKPLSTSACSICHDSTANNVKPRQWAMGLFWKLSSVHVVFSQDVAT